jgi:hypothetical protein
MLRRHRTRDPRYEPLIDAAQPAVAAAIAVLRRMPYAELEALRGRKMAIEWEADGGETLCRDTQVYFDGGWEGDLRVTVDVTWPADPHWIKRPLLLDGFILEPDGSVVDG